MEVTLAGGAVIDVATRADVAEHHRRLNELLAKPNAHGQRLAGSTPTGGGPLVIDLGSPPMGMLWLPQYVAITGADCHLGASNAVIANVSGAVFAGRLVRVQELALGPPVTGEDIAGCIAPGLTIPQAVQLPDKAAVYGNEHLYVVLAGTGLAAGSATVYRAGAFVIEVPFTDSVLA